MRRVSPDIAVYPEHKRRRYDHAFTLLDNSGDTPAPNPPLFYAHPLREEQLRALSWMLEQESRTLGVRGGVLADRMGSGKTATTIGLISLGAPALCFPEQLRAVDGHIACKATLVLCPEHLVTQWESEFCKFLPANKLKVVAMRGGGPRSWKRRTGHQILDADVIIAPYRLQGTDEFKTRFGITGNALSRLDQLKHLVKHWQSAVDDASFHSELSKGAPILQLFHFHRIVMDEFHEAEGWGYRTRMLYEQTSATHRWGLSGTPPIADVKGVVDLAEILHYSKDPRAADYRNSPTEWRHNLCRRVPLPAFALAQRFLDECVRQNSSEVVEAIQVCEHLETVVHTRAERLIYQQACADHGIFDLARGYEGVCKTTREALLKRCAHFAIGKETGAAEATVELLGVAKRDRIRDLKAQLAIELKRAERFGMQYRPNSEHPETAAFLRVAACQVDCFALEQDDQQNFRLVQPIRESEYCSDAVMNANRIHTLRHGVARHSKSVMGRLAHQHFNQLVMCTEACKPGRLETVMREAMDKLTKMLDDAHRSFQFYQRQVGSVKSASSRNCLVCLDEDIPVRELCILPCSHIFHTACAREVLAATGTCPSCRAPVTLRELRHFQLEVEAPTPPELASVSPAWRSHGSKLNAIAGALRKIRQEDPDAKAVVFVQWRDIENRVAEALQAHGVSFHRLEDGNREGAILEEFQTSPRSFVILLSLERAASGANLTAANHVVFVHPMTSETLATAIAFERQAIARVRRIGQQREQVHVWRFITRHTIEEHITQIHREVRASEPVPPIIVID